MTSPWAAETVASSADTTGTTTTTGRRWSNINNSQLVRRKEPSPQGGVSSSRSSPSSPSITEEDLAVQVAAQAAFDETGETLTRVLEEQDETLQLLRDLREELSDGGQEAQPRGHPTRGAASGATMSEGMGQFYRGAAALRGGDSMETLDSGPLAGGGCHDTDPGFSFRSTPELLSHGRLSSGRGNLLTAQQRESVQDLARSFIFGNHREIPSAVAGGAPRAGSESVRHVAPSSGGGSGGTSPHRKAAGPRKREAA